MTSRVAKKENRDQRGEKNKIR